MANRSLTVTALLVSACKRLPQCLPRLLQLQIFRKLQRLRRSFFHGPLDRLLIAPQNLSPATLAQIASLDIQKDVHLPRPESVAGNCAAQQFLNQLVEASQYGFAVLDGIYHTLSIHRRIEEKA